MPDPTTAAPPDGLSHAFAVDDGAVNTVNVRAEVPEATIYALDVPTEADDSPPKATSAGLKGSDLAVSLRRAR